MEPALALKDIHLPDPISWWPLAPGWYISAFMAGILFYSISYGIYRHWRYHQARRYALKCVKQLRKNTHAQKNQQRVVGELSQLLRRVALAYFPREYVADLQGDAWLQFLDASANMQEFTRGTGRVFAAGPYQAYIQQDLKKVFDLVQRWLRRLKVSASKKNKMYKMFFVRSEER